VNYKINFPILMNKPKNYAMVYSMKWHFPDRIQPNQWRNIRQKGSAFKILWITLNRRSVKITIIKDLPQLMQIQTYSIIRLWHSNKSIRRLMRLSMIKFDILILIVETLRPDWWLNKRSPPVSSKRRSHCRKRVWIL